MWKHTNIKVKNSEYLHLCIASHKLKFSKFISNPQLIEEKLNNQKKNESWNI